VCDAGLTCTKVVSGNGTKFLCEPPAPSADAGADAAKADAGADAAKADAGEACGAQGQACCGSAGTCGAGLACTKVVSNDGTKFLCEPPTPVADAGTDATKADGGAACGAQNQVCCGSAGTCNAGLTCTKLVSGNGTAFRCEP
jgi:hypothetical protein